MLKKSILVLVLGVSIIGSTQNEDSILIRKMFNEALSTFKSYDYLRSLCKDVGPRLTASPNSYKAVNWGIDLLKSLSPDTVYTQEITVPYWERGSTAYANLLNKDKTPLEIAALGMSDGTGKKGVTGNVIAVYNDKEVDSLGKAGLLKDKIVFFNRSWNSMFWLTGKAYGGCVSQRTWGAVKAAKYDAKAVLVRSVSSQRDNRPHTGSMKYVDSIKHIPSAAISMISADILTKELKKDSDLKLTYFMDCKNKPDTTHYNVVAEIKGSEFPNEYITVGGHLDSWDLGEGAHDDGAGIAHTIEAMRLIMKSGYQPKRTMRFVLFMNEENGNSGGKAYAKYAKNKNEKHLMALESDAGGFTPRGFTIDGSANNIKFIQQWHKLLSPYGLDVLRKGWGGVDIYPLKKYDPNITLIGFMPDTQRYFDLHHAKNDVFENVDDRELELGAASIASMLYLVDKYGLEHPIN